MARVYALKRLMNSEIAIVDFLVLESPEQVARAISIPILFVLHDETYADYCWSESHHDEE